MRYILFLFVFASTTLFGQIKTFSVDGTVKDRNTKEKLEFATVEVRNQSDSLICATITNSEGKFFLSLPKEKYLLKINYLGYNEHKVPVALQNTNVYLGNIFVLPSAQSLESVTVVGRSKKVDIDRDVHIVTKQMKAGSTAVKNLLENIRGVTYDYIENTISVNNKGNVLLLVDGLEKNQEYVKNIAPDRVSRVEVYRQPSGKYANEGYSAIINLILKKDYSGVELYTEERGVFSLDKSNGDDVLFQNDYNLNLTLTHKKINLYGMYANHLQNTNIPIFAEKQLDDLKLVSGPLDGSEPNHEKEGFSHSTVFGVDYFLNPRHVISFENSYKTSPRSKNGYSESFRQILYDNNTIVDQYNYKFASKYESESYYGSLSYKGKPNEKNSLKIDLGYNFFDKTEQIGNSKSSSVQPSQEIHGTKDFTNLAVNYTYRANDRLSFESGYTNVFKKNISKSKRDLSWSVPVKYKEYRNKFYTYSNIKVSDKITSKIGLNYEYINQNVDGRSYGNSSLQPLVNLHYKASDNTSFIAKYISKSSYPTNYQLNPFAVDLDVLTQRIGNIQLEPSNINEMSCEMNLFNNKLSIEPFYNFDDEHISPTGTILQDDHMFQYSYDNVDKYESAGLNVSFKLSFFKKSLFWNFVTRGWREYIKYDNQSHHYYDYSIRTNLLYRSKKYKTIAAIILKRENNKSIVSNGYEAGGNDNLSVLLKQPLAKRKFDITLLYYLPVNAGFDYNMKGKLHYNSYQEYTNSDVSLLKNLFLVKLSYNFNTGIKVKHISKSKFIENESHGKSIL